MSVNDVVFATNKNARGSIELIRSCMLTSWNLYKKICARISWFTPFPNDMIQSQIQFVVGQHLGEKMCIPFERQQI